MNHRASTKRRAQVWLSKEHSNEVLKEAYQICAPRSDQHWESFIEYAVIKGRYKNHVLEAMTDCPGLPKKIFLRRLCLESPQEMNDMRRFKEDPLFLLHNELHILKSNVYFTSTRLTNNLELLRKLLLQPGYCLRIESSEKLKDYHQFIRRSLELNHPKVTIEALYTAVITAIHAPSIFEGYRETFLISLMSLIDKCYESRNTYFLDRFKADSSRRIYGRYTCMVLPEEMPRYKRNYQKSAPMFTVAAVATYCFTYILIKLMDAEILTVAVGHALSAGHLSQRLFFTLLNSALKEMDHDDIQEDAQLHVIICDIQNKIEMESDEGLPHLNHSLMRTCEKFLLDLMINKMPRSSRRFVGGQIPQSSQSQRWSLALRKRPSQIDIESLLVKRKSIKGKGFCRSATNVKAEEPQRLSIRFPGIELQTFTS